VILLVLAPPALLCVLGFAAFVSRNHSRAAEVLGSWAGAAAGVAGLAATIAALVIDATWSLSLPWLGKLGGSFTIGLDPVTGLFLLPVYGLSAASSLYGGTYLRHALHNTPAGRAGASWLAFHLLSASMVLVLLARNGVLFLAAWETMTLASWYLVTIEDAVEKNRAAGITYLVASQIGTVCLLAFFALLGAHAAPGGPAGALDFARFGGLAVGPSAAAFLLALVGFGTKAGLVPLHVWLPEAHPAAPSHVSALMSGVMIKMGVYGLVRTLLILGPGPAWQGWVMLAVGAVSGVLGVLLALAQHDLKRLLAYHSVENIGIICLGLGLGMLGTTAGAPLMALLGYAGALLHVINHAIFKGLLFLGAGSVAASTGTRDIEQLGGLLKRMPVTAAAFLAGSVAICGLPPLNGFVSEFLVFSAGLRDLLAPGASEVLAGTIAVGTLALIGGLAAACFTKAFGIVFLGEPRSSDAVRAAEPAAPMLVPMLGLAVLCAGIGFLGGFAVRLASAPAALLAGLEPPDAASLLVPAAMSLGRVALVSAGAVALIALLVGLRSLLLSRKEVRKAVTWDCGYAKPTARMQYTASSFAAPLLGMFRRLFPSAARSAAPEDLFPEDSRFDTHHVDAIDHRLVRPGFAAVGRIAAYLRRLQHGRLRWYVLYIALALVALLVWKLG
jgi:hydrogenase-4 component B